MENASKARFAEALLSLVTSSERAASITGDIAEETHDRAGCWFCFYLICVSLALLLRGLQSTAWRSLWLLSSGLALWFFLYSSIRIVGAVSGVHAVDATLLECTVMPLSSFAYLAVTLCLSNLITGFVMGRRVPAGGLNACTPLATFWALYAVAAPIASVFLAAPSWYCTMIYLVALPLLYVMPLLAGGALARRRAFA